MSKLKRNLKEVYAKSERLREFSCVICGARKSVKESEYCGIRCESCNRYMQRVDNE